MGILHSTSRFFGCKTEDEEGDENPIYPSLFHYNGGGDSSEQLPKISSVCNSIYKAILLGLRFVFSFVWRRKTANHVLPIQSTSREPLLGQTRYSDEGRSQRGVVDVLSHKQLQPEKEQRDRDVVLLVPGLTTTYSDVGRSQRGIVDFLSHKQLQPEKKQRDRDVVLPVPGLTATNSDVGRSQRGIVDYLSHKQLQPEKKQMDRDVVLPVPGSRRPASFKSAIYKEVSSSSTTVSVRKDGPRNVTVLGKKKADGEVSSIIVIEEKWIKHYSSRHRILLVGDGDFSFSASLAVAFSSAPNIIATSLDSQEFLKKNYFKAASNVEKLRGRESKVMHEVDATKMANHPSLGHLKFDRIIFNFPYAGLANIKNLPRDSQLRRHRKLVGKFLKNASEMLSENGEIHISHKTNTFHEEFNLESTASRHRLKLIEAVNFNCLEFPGYYTKYGFGGDRNFDCYPSKTYKFGLKKFQHN